jgi:hypothetical protein
MLTEYSSEQKQINVRLAAIEAELATESNDEQNVQKLKAVLDEYLNIETLTANMLNQLIERIKIGHTIKVDGCRQQEIAIVYRFIGTQTKFETGIKLRITTVQSPFTVAGYIYMSRRNRILLSPIKIL